MKSMKLIDVESFTADFFTTTCTCLNYDSLSDLSPNQLRCLLPSASRIFEKARSSKVNDDMVKWLSPFLTRFDLSEILVSKVQFDTFLQNISSKDGSRDLFKPPSYTASDFEQSDVFKRLNIVYELLFLQWNFKKNDKFNCPQCEYKKEIVNIECIFNEVSDFTCLIVAEASGSFDISTLLVNILHSKFGVVHLLKVVFNMPCVLFTFVKIILQLPANECTLFENNRFLLIKQLCVISSFASSHITEYCLSNETHLHILFSIVSDKDMLNLLMTLMLDRKRRIWLISFLQSHQDDSFEKRIFNQFRERLCKIGYEWMPASQIIIIFCALKSCLNLKFNNEEINMLITVMNRCKRKELPICLLLLCPSIINEHESEISNYLLQLVETRNDTFRLIALCCHTNRIQELNETVSRLLEFPVLVKSNSLAKLSSFLTNDLLLHDFLITQNSALEVTSDLSVNTNKPLPVYYLIQVFESRTYKTVESDGEKISDWIWNQILKTVLPLDSACIKLIQAYVKALFCKENCFTHCIRYERLLELFSNDDFNHMLTPKILALFYLLLYEEKFIETSSICSYKYPSEVFHVIPIGYYLEISNVIEYSLIYPSLVRLVTKLFPHILLTECKIYAQDIRFFANSPAKTFEMAVCLMDNSELTIDLCYWLKLIWSKAYTAYGQRLILKTAQMVLKNPTLTYNEIVNDPLLLFKVDVEMFSNIPLVEVFLFVVQAFLIASERTLSNALKTETEAQAHKRSNADIKRLIPCSHCSVVHILLEVLTTAQKKFGEVVCCALRNVIFAFLHKLFIADINLARLIHIQTYDCELIPLVVKEVPSIHVCIDSIPQILSDANINKQIFGLKLASCLAEQYPLPQTFVMARLVMNVTATMTQVYTHQDAKRFFTETAPCIITFCKVFPPLLEDGIALLQEMAQLCGGSKVTEEFSLAGLL